MKQKNFSWIYLIIIVGIALFFIITLSIISVKPHSQYDWNSKSPEISHYWTCMDGCYYMEEIILGDLSYENETQKKYHRDCSEICWQQLIDRGGVGNIN